MNEGFGQRRRLLAALFAALGTGLAILAVQPPAPQTVRIAVAARDLAAGAALRPGDVRIIGLPPAARPDGALRNPPVGRVLSGAVRRGEALTDARVLGPGLLDEQPPGTVAAPVRVADSAAARLLHPGDRVDVLAATPSGADADLPSISDVPAPTPSPDGTRAPPAGKPSAGAPTPSVRRAMALLADGRVLWRDARTTAGQHPIQHILKGGLGVAGLTFRSRVVVASVVVLAVPREEGGLGSATQGALVVLATSRGQAAALAGAGGPLVVTLVRD